MEAVTEPAPHFAGLLRQFRSEARLTQEELAEAAGLSPRSVSDLERGINRTARKDTAVLLADALGLTGQVRVLFVAAARGRASAAEVLAARLDGVADGSAAAATRSLPRDIGSFTGREPELARLLGTLAGVTAGGGPPGICVIDGMAGIGKTTLAVHAAHRLTGSFPDGQFFLSLHAHTPGQRPVSPAEALASLLLTAGVAVQQIPPGMEARAGRWRDYLAGKKILLLLDDAAGHEQVRPLLGLTPGADIDAYAVAALDDTRSPASRAAMRAVWYCSAAWSQWPRARRKPPNLPGQAYALNHLGLVQVDLADYPAAAASHWQALELARDAGDQLAQAVSLIDLGLVQQMTGDYQAASASYEQALPLARRVGSAFDEADALCELGTVRRLTGDYPAAITCEHQALDLFHHLGDRLGQAWALDELGQVHQLTGDYQAAAACLAEAIELFGDLGNRHGLAKALNSLGELSLRTSAAQESRTRHAEALAIARELGTPGEQARALEGIGRSLLHRDPAQAAAHLREALEIYQKIGAPEARRVRDTLDDQSL